jgi:hypothetical protein
MDLSTGFRDEYTAARCDGDHVGIWREQLAPGSNSHSKYPESLVGSSGAGWRLEARVRIELTCALQTKHVIDSSMS